jgi:hypothetical protein
MHLILGSRNYLCLHCQKPFFYSDSTIDAGLFLTMFGIVLLLVTFAIDSFVIDDAGAGILEMLGYVFSVMVITFGVAFIHLSK